MILISILDWCDKLSIDYTLLTYSTHHLKNKGNVGGNDD
jgi:hypothetical protein